MAGRVVHVHLVVAELDHRAVVEHVGRGLRRHLEAEHRALLYGRLVQKQVVAVQVDRDAAARSSRPPRP